nr:RNA-directed DNA polymerase, eukaryota, reverse transcriptase zinc-binding domain protein [Tanacetum cinerariifolium]
RAVWDCGIDKSPGLDVFTFGFYRRFWNVIENDVYDVVKYFFTYGVIPKGCNSSFIALIPKILDANTVKDFRQISLIGNDAVFVVQWCDGNITTLVYVLECFYRASRLQINMSKSKIMGVFVDSDKVRVIKAIHGDDRKVGGYVKDGAKSCWLSIVNEINSLKKKAIKLLDFMYVKLGNGDKTAFWEDIWIEDKALKNRYPRIYSLETCNMITVGMELAQTSLDSSFRRVPRGGVEQEQFDELSALVYDVTLTPMSDRWIWTLKSSGDFFVASVRKVIDDKSLSKIDSKTRWIKYVPIKVNVHAWKVKIDSLPTRDFWIRNKEAPGWVLDFMEENDDEQQNDNGGFNVHESGSCGGDSDVEGVLETIFEESGQKEKNLDEKHTNKQENHSGDPFMVDGMWIESPNRVKGEFFHHFSSRFDKLDVRRAHIEMSYPKTLTCDQQRAVWDCGIDKSPGSDVFTFGFYRRLWNLIENDVYDAVKYLFTYGVIPKGCNSSFIALIPKIPDANTTNLDSSFCRVLRGGVEQEQFDELSALVHDVTLTPMSDRWIWTLKSSGDFSVASVRKVIDDKSLPKVDSKTRWIRYVPIKVNVHARKEDSCARVCVSGGGGVGTVGGGGRSGAESGAEKEVVVAACGGDTPKTFPGDMSPEKVNNFVV